MNWKIWISCLMMALGPAIASAHGDAEEYNVLGEPGILAKTSRTVDVALDDSMRFTPSRIVVKQGETIRFRLKNDGKLKHEMVLGTLKELREHAALMKKMPGMVHSDPNMASVAPGSVGELVWHFTKRGTFSFACLQPGHFEAGMRGTVVVNK